MQHAPKKLRVFSFWGKGGGGQVLNFLISRCSHQVPNVFPTMFPIAPHFYLICFTQSYPLSSYTVEPKGMHSHLPTKSSILGSLQNLNCFFLWWTNQNGSLPKKEKKKRKILIGGHPDLIKMNKCPDLCSICDFSNGKNYTRFYKNVHLVLHCVFIFGKLWPIFKLKKNSYHYKEKMWGNFIFNHQKTSNNKWDGPKNVDNRP
jgi:hypothetical protein